MSHPAIPTLLFCVLSFYPIMKLYARVGLPRGYAWLIFASMIIPFSGIMLTAMVLAVQSWPHFPKMTPPPKPVKLEIS